MFLNQPLQTQEPQGQIVWIIQLSSSDDLKYCQQVTRHRGSLSCKPNHTAAISELHSSDTATAARTTRGPARSPGAALETSAHITVLTCTRAQEIIGLISLDMIHSSGIKNWTSWLSSDFWYKTKIETSEIIRQSWSAYTSESLRAGVTLDPSQEQY